MPSLRLCLNIVQKSSLSRLRFVKRNLRESTIFGRPLHHPTTTLAHSLRHSARQDALQRTCTSVLLDLYSQSWLRRLVLWDTMCYYMRFEVFCDWIFFCGFFIQKYQSASTERSTTFSVYSPVSRRTLTGTKYFSKYKRCQNYQNILSLTA